MQPKYAATLGGGGGYFCILKHSVQFESDKNYYKSAHRWNKSFIFKADLRKVVEGQ
jgi:hypothetical protein